MSLNIGSKELIDCKYGNTQINEIYLGNTLIWPTFISGVYPVIEAIYKIHGVQPLLFLPLNGNTRTYLSKIKELDYELNSTFIDNASFVKSRLEDNSIYGGGEYGRSYIRNRGSSQIIKLPKSQIGSLEGLTCFISIKIVVASSNTIKLMSDSDSKNNWYIDDSSHIAQINYGNGSSTILCNLQGYSVINSNWHNLMLRAGAKDKTEAKYSLMISEDATDFYQTTTAISQYTGIIISGDNLLFMPSVTIGSTVQDYIQDIIVYDIALPNYFNDAILLHTYYPRSNGFNYIAPIALCCYYDSNQTNYNEMNLISIFTTLIKFGITSDIILNGRTDVSNVIEKSVDFTTLTNPEITYFTQFDMNTSPYSSDFISMVNGLDIRGLIFEATSSLLDSDAEEFYVHLIGYTDLNKSLDDQDYCVLGTFKNSCVYSGFEPNALKDYSGKILWVSPVLDLNKSYTLPDGVIDLQRNNNSVLTTISLSSGKPLIGCLFNGTPNTLDKSYCTGQWAGIFYGNILPDASDAWLNYEQGFESYKLAWNPTLRTGGASSNPTCYYIGIENVNYNKIVDAFSLTICFKLTESKNSYALMGNVYNQSTSRHYGISIGLVANKLTIIVDFDNNHTSLSTLTPEINKWYNLVIRTIPTKSGTKIVRYSIYARINDQDFSQQYTLNASNISFTSLSTSITPRAVFPLGAGISSGNVVSPFPGAIQDVFIWNRTLSYDEFENIGNYYKNKGMF